MEPTLYIIAGCNGAGKTTASYSVLPELLDCREFVNANEIAKGLSPFNPESVAIEAGRLMLRRIDLLLQRRKTFAIETTLATRSYASLVERAHEQGYTVVLLFFWLPTPEMAVFQEKVSQSKPCNKSFGTLQDKITVGLKRSYEDLLRRKAAMGLDMVVGDAQGQPVEVPAYELLAKYEETQERNL